MIQKKKKESHFSALLALAVIWSLWPALQISASAELQEVRVLDCHYEAASGEGYAGYAVHVHNSDCLDTYYELCCPLPYIPPHTHSQSCYNSEKELICGKLELHTHSKDCYADGVLTCGLPELQEHVHDENCFKLQIVDVDPDTGETTVISEPMADLETEDDWADSVADVKLTGDWREDLLSIAQSQLGYSQSSKNIAPDGEFAGGHYTRYGDWYGYPYGAWCAMFVSFCLHYAGVPEEAFPYESGTVSWVYELQRRGQFEYAADYEPIPGDIVFFDQDDGRADHVGIVVGIDNGALLVIEGNHSTKVEMFTYPNYRSLYYILGYGKLMNDENNAVPNP